MIIAIAVAALVGVALGAIISTRVSVTPTPTPESDVSPAMPVVDRDDELPTAVMRVVDRLDLAVVLGDTSSKVRYRNPAASALSGTHVGVIVDEHVDVALADAVRDEPTSKRIDLHGPPRVSLELVAERLDNGWALVLVDDVSERQRIDAMRTDFVANISHELKTPVGAIAVLAEMLEGETDPDVVRRVSARIGEESMRAVGTIDDLLELSRIESARLTDDVVDLNDIVQLAVARGRVVDSGKRVEVTALGSPGDDLFLLGDRRQLTSAIGNLVENAVKYSDDGGSVQVRTRVGDRWIEVMVIDQGMGIPERDLDRVFERFYRVDRARSRETGGTGLGLSIVRHVASNHGGDVSVSSQEGQGSTFVLRLPASLLTEVADADDDPDAEMVTGRSTAEMGERPR